MPSARARFPIRFRHALMLGGFIPLAMTVPAASPTAQLINPFSQTWANRLNSDDLAAVTQATNQLLDLPNLTAGETESWSNPQSGARGIATAGNAVRRKGLPCRVVHYEAEVPGPRPLRGLDLTWCKTNEGWKLGW